MEHEGEVTVVPLMEGREPEKVYGPGQSLATEPRRCPALTLSHMMWAVASVKAIGMEVMTS
jgi:hypothetical protein